MVRPGLPNCNDSTSGQFSVTVVGRLDPFSHSITEFGLEFVSLRPYGIAFGSDGAIWFGEFGGDTIECIAIGSSSAVRRRDPATFLSRRLRGTRTFTLKRGSVGCTPGATKP